MWVRWVVLLATVSGISLGTMAPGAGAEEVTVDELRCEYLENPLCVDAQAPRLSWKLVSEAAGARQTAYQVLVASSAKKVALGQGDLWDSGKISSSRNVLVPYTGAALASRQTCHWKVRVWDQHGLPSDWSAPAQWRMGLLGESDWQGVYIGLDPADGDPEFPWLRKTVTLNARPDAALVYVNPLGYYELYINGQKVDDHFFMPAVSQFNKRSWYVAHDVKDYLQEGENCIAFWMGAGWYADGLPGVVHTGPLVRAQLEAHVAGKTVTAATDESWKAHPSSYSREGKWWSGQYGGEQFDARKCQPGWNTADFDAGDWPGATAVEVPAHTVSAHWAEPNRSRETLEPVSIARFRKKGWLADFGKNTSGHFEIRLEGLEPGQRLRIEYADRVEEGELKSFNQRDILLASEEGVLKFRNRFNYHSFRYAFLWGLDEKPPADAMKAHLVHTDYPLAASFACSNELLTDIHDMLFYTLRCLSLGAYLVDCPHIERLGYGGDGQASTPTALTMFGMGPLYTAWLAHWRDCQRPDGGMPHTAPNPWSAGGGPYWCGFIIAASHEMYVQYGDTRILEANYPHMQRWLDGYVEEYSEDGLLQRWPDEDYRNWYLGDWARPERNEENAERSVHLVNNCFVVQCHDWMAHIADILGKPGESARYAAKADATRQRVHEAFWDDERGTYADDTQLDLAYPLLVGVVPPGLVEAVSKRLEDKILVAHDGHLDVGLVGVPLLTQQLLESGRNDLVFSYVNKKTFPGWGYMLENGATTTWEHWDAHRSHIHNCYNGVGMWFYRGLAGIRPEPEHPGFRHFTLKPALVGDIAWVKAHQDTVRGRVESAWRIEKDRFEWEVTVPPNSAATIHLPTGDAESVTVSGKPLGEAPGLLRKTQSPGSIAIEAQPGRYAFAMPYRE